VDTSTGTTTQSLTQLMMPSSDEIARGRRKLHRKAALIAILAVTSYVGLVVTHVGFLLQVMFAAVLVVASVATATSVMHDGNTNVVGFDTDIDQMPFARLAPRSRGSRRTDISTCTCGRCSASSPCSGSCCTTTRPSSTARWARTRCRVPVIRGFVHWQMGRRPRPTVASR